MKRFYLSCIALLMMLSATAAPNPAQIFKNTTRHIDFDGNLLLYYNTTELFELLQKFPAQLTAAGKAIQAAPPAKLQLINDSADLIIKSLNLHALQAAAWSLKPLKNGLYISKESLYLGNNALLPGIFNCTGITNRFTLDGVLSELPSDLIAAVKFQFNTAGFYAGVEKNVNSSPNAEIKAYYNMAKTMLATQGIDLKQLLGSASGEFTFIAAGDSPETLRSMLIIPDQNGAVAAACKKFFPADSTAPDRSFLPAKGLKFRPALLYLDKKTVLVSDFASCTKASKPFDVPADFRRHLPENAATIGIINISAQLLKNVRNIPIKNPKQAAMFRKFIDTLTPGLAVEMLKVERDGTRSVTISNFTLSDLYYKLCGAFSQMSAVK